MACRYPIESLLFQIPSRFDAQYETDLVDSLTSQGRQLFCDMLARKIAHLTVLSRRCGYLLDNAQPRLYEWVR